MITIDTGAINALATSTTAIAQGMLPVIAIVFGVSLAFFGARSIINIFKTFRGG